MGNSDCKITVILPFYNTGNELDTAIRSIFRQEFPHWRLLLVSNNGSKEGEEIAHCWAGYDSRISVLNESRQGIAFALNRGLEYTSDEYIARMDADDQALPGRFLKQIEFLDRNPSIGVVSSQTEYRSVIEGSMGYSLFVDWQNSIISHEDHLLYRFVESPLAHPSVMFRRTLIERYGMYSTEELPEDYELWLRWMRMGVGFYKLPEKLLIWNDHDERLSRQHENYSREAFFQVKCNYLARWIKDNVVSDKKVVVCGSSRIGRKRAALLSEHGVDVFGFTDVKKRPNRQVNFVRLDEITQPEPYFLVNFIGKRGVGQSLREHFSELGFVEGRDFIMAA